MAILEIKELGINFGGLKAVDKLNMTIEEGQLYGLIGPNGAGKTTVFNLLTGVYQATEGVFYFDGNEVKNSNPVKMNKMGIARTFQNIRLFSQMTVLDNVLAGFHASVNYGLLSSITHLGKFSAEEKIYRKKALELLEVFDIAAEKDYLACNLPYGKQRKLEIARALATNPKLLLLDEPAAGMNPNETAELMQTIKSVRDKFNITILLIEHDMRLVSGICEEITVLNFGTVLAQGKTKDVLNDPKVITAYLGEDD